MYSDAPAWNTPETQHNTHHEHKIQARCQDVRESGSETAKIVHTYEESGRQQVYEIERGEERRDRHRDRDRERFEKRWKCLYEGYVPSSRGRLGDCHVYSVL